MKYLFVLFSMAVAQQATADTSLSILNLKNVKALACSDSRSRNSSTPGHIMISFFENGDQKAGIYEYKFDGNLKRFHAIARVTYKFENAVPYKVGLAADGSEVVKMSYKQLVDQWGSHFYGNFKLKYNNGYQETGFAYACIESKP